MIDGVTYGTHKQTELLKFYTTGIEKKYGPAFALVRVQREKNSRT